MLDLRRLVGLNGEEWETVVFDLVPTDPPSAATHSPKIGIRQVWLQSGPFTKVVLRKGDRIKCKTHRSPGGQLTHWCVSECLAEDESYKQVGQFWWWDYPSENRIPRGWVPADGTQNATERGGTGKDTRRHWLVDRRLSHDDNIVFETLAKIVIQRIK